LRGGVPTLVEIAHPLSFSLDRNVQPRCVVGCRPEDVMRAVRALERSRPVPLEGPRPLPSTQCSAELSLRIDLDGKVTVTDTDAVTNHGDVDCERGFRRWAVGTRWTPAYSDGQPVAVVIKQRVTYRTN
jgi:hypothetical protein